MNSISNMFKYSIVEDDIEIEYEFPTQTVSFKKDGVAKNVQLIFCNDDFRYPPCNYYFIPASGGVVFIKTRNKQIAQAAIDAWIGKVNFYKVRVLANKK